MFFKYCNGSMILTRERFSYLASTHWSEVTLLLNLLHECKNMIIMLFNSTTTDGCQFNCHLTKTSILMKKETGGTYNKPDYYFHLFHISKKMEKVLSTAKCNIWGNFIIVFFLSGYFAKWKSVKFTFNWKLYHISYDIHFINQV